MTESNMTCEAFDAALPDYLEGTLAEPMRAAVSKHLSECVRCTSLVRDLEKIQKEAAALPDLAPSRDLWQGIEARISAAVIPFATRPERRRRVVPAWMGIAAAALVVSTAGITYMLTARSFQSETPNKVALIVPGVTVTDSQPENGPQPGNGNEPVQTSQSTPGANGSNRAAAKSSLVAVRNPGVAANRQVQGALLAVAPINAEQRSERVYSREIDMLQGILTQRRTQLDSSTVSIIERNLQIIDAAIASSRAALAKDPASRLLSDQLTHALDKKVELLRTAALLPST
ncbi:MAG TPA: zf-HC2 domain-containing protein [Gemmatimonadaceae bacterium]